MKKIFLTLAFSIFFFMSYSQWQSLYSPTSIHLNEACFIDENTGYVAGGMGGSNGTVLKTIDGESFTELNFPFYNQLNSISLINDEIGFVAGHGGLIAKTVDGGNSWNELNSNSSNQFNSIFFIDEDIGFVTGAGGDIFKTMDGGLTWNNIYSNIYFQMNHIRFVNSDIGFVAADYGNIAKTEDGGLSWDLIDTDASGNLFCIEFLNDDIGFACSTLGEILKTDNGGESWSVNSEITSSALRYISFNSEEVFISGNNGIILHSVDLGDTWEFEESNTTNSLQAILFSSDSKGFAFGFDGEIIISECSVYTSEIEIQEPSLNNFTFSIYPNPVNDLLNVESEIDIKGSFFIQLFSINGQMVFYRRYDSQTNSKVYESLNLDQLNKGIYILKVGTNEHFQINKIEKM